MRSSLEDADAVHQPQPAHDGAETAKEDSVGGEATFRVGGYIWLLLGRGKDGTCLAESIFELGAVGVGERLLSHRGL